jgi:hypothetical protein
MPWERRLAGSKVRLGLSSSFSFICTNPCILQWFVHLDAARRASFPRPLWESRCRRDTGPVLRRAARVKDFSSPAEASARIGHLLRRGSLRDGAPPQNACFKSTSVSKFCAASRLPQKPPRCGKAETLPLREPWMYVAGYSPRVLGPSTHSTVLFSSLRPSPGLFARGSRS